MTKKTKVKDFVIEDDGDNRKIRDAFSYNVIAEFKGFNKKAKKNG